MKLELFQEQICTSTAEDESNHFTGEVITGTSIHPNTVIPGGLYRVVDGDLFRLVDHPLTVLQYHPDVRSRSLSINADTAV